MAENCLMVIPCIKQSDVSQYFWQGLDNYSYQCPRIIITNKDIDPTSKEQHKPTYGTKKLTYAMDKFNPDIMIFHAIDWLVENDTLKIIVNSLLNDKNIVSAGVRPWHNNTATGWRPCMYNQEAHCCSIVCAYSSILYPFVRKINEITPNTEVWNQACYMAVLKGMKVKPVFSYLYSTGMH